MTNWFTQNGKVLTNNGKIRGCCCSEPCTSWSPYGFGWGAAGNGFERSGDDCPSGTLHFSIINRTGGDRTWTYCGNNLSVPESGDDYDNYSVVIPEGCNLLSAPIVNFPNKYRYWLSSWSWVED